MVNDNDESEISFYLDWDFNLDARAGKSGKWRQEVQVAQSNNAYTVTLGQKYPKVHDVILYTNRETFMVSNRTSKPVTWNGKSFVNEIKGSVTPATWYWDT